ncbi:MAG: hypothetical protein JNN11_03865 [Candidatus Doudnabacteria bacterium]|nr:hypothetical protein [Candidatus Doudnabacteria bacterium]
MKTFFSNPEQIIRRKSSMSEQADYKKLLTELIQKQMVILGPNIALDTARKVPGIRIAGDGVVLEIIGDPVMVLRSVAQEYTVLSSYVTQMALNVLKQKYPSMAY